MSQTAKIYALTFLEGGNTWQGWGSYNPFQLKRSAGIGIRVYMGAFGLIGFDFAFTDSIKQSEELSQTDGKLTS